MQITLDVNFRSDRKYDMCAIVHYSSGKVFDYYDEHIPQSVFNVDESVHKVSGIDTRRWDFKEVRHRNGIERVYKRKLTQPVSDRVKAELRGERPVLRLKDLERCANNGK